MTKRKYCNFNVRTTKAYIDNEGLKHIEAIASDTGIDYYYERFAERAIDDMVSYARSKSAIKPQEGAVGLLETHWDTFSIGFADDGEKIEDSKFGLQTFKVDLALKPNVWQAEELYADVKNKQIDKQLSVGGYIPDWETDYEVVDEVYTNEDGEEVTVQVGVIKRFILEHIAVTPPNGAANPRTEFVTAKSKPDVYQLGSVFKSAHDENYQKRFINKMAGGEETEDEVGTKEFWTKFKSLIGEVVTEVFGEREERMTKLEKAKKMAEDFRKFVEENTEDFSDEEVLKSLGVSFVKEEDTEEVEKLTSDAVTEIVKARLDELVVDIDGKIEKMRESIPEIPELPTIPEDKSEEIETLKSKLEEYGSKFEDLEKRIKAIEEEAPESQDDPVVVEKEDEEEIEEEEDDSKLPEDLKAWA
jgi:hypothetical protein